MEGVDAETIFVRLIRGRMCSLGVGSFRTSGVRAASFRCTCIEWRFSGETSGPANVGRFDGRSNTEVLDRWVFQTRRVARTARHGRLRAVREQAARTELPCLTEVDVRKRSVEASGP